MKPQLIRLRLARFPVWARDRPLLVDLTALERGDYNRERSRLRSWWRDTGAPSYLEWLNQLFTSVRRSAEEYIN